MLLMKEFQTHFPVAAEKIVAFVVEKMQSDFTCFDNFIRRSCKCLTKLPAVSHVEKSLLFIDKNTRFDWLLNFQRKQIAKVTPSRK